MTKDGVKPPLATLKITDTQLELYPEESEKPDIVSKLAAPVNKTGYARIWIHLMKKPVKITDVMPAEAIATAGKTVTISDDGLVVISSAAVEDTDVLTVLYRALM